MNLPRFRSKRLDSRGASHIVLPLAAIMLLAVGGTFMMVAKNSGVQNLSLATGAASKTKKEPVRDGKLYLDRAGIYKEAQITGVNIDPKRHRCHKKFDSNSKVLVKLAKKNQNGKPKEVTCSAIGGTTQYRVEFGSLKNGKFVNNMLDGGYVAIDIDEGYCTYLTAGKSVAEAVVTKAKLDNKKKCFAKPATVVKTDIYIRALPPFTETKNGKKVDYAYIDVSPINQGQSLDRYQCAAQATVRFESAAPAHVKELRLPIKYVERFDQGLDKSYCASKYKVPVKQLKAGAKYRISATLANSGWLNQASNEITSEYQMPAKAAKSTGGTQAPLEATIAVTDATQADAVKMRGMTGQVTLTKDDGTAFKKSECVGKVHFAVTVDKKTKVQFRSNLAFAGDVNAGTCGAVYKSNNSKILACRVYDTSVKLVDTKNKMTADEIREKLYVAGKRKLPGNTVENCFAS